MSISIHPHIGFQNTDFKIVSDKETILGIGIIRIADEFGNQCKNKNVSFIYNEESGSLQFKESGTLQITLFSDEKGPITNTIIVKDAIRLGGSILKEGYVFDETPWCFIVMHDRMYFYNRETRESFLENISPDNIKVVSNSIVIFFNDNDKDAMLFSLERREVIGNFNNVIYFTEDTLFSAPEYGDNENREMLAVRFSNIVDYRKNFIYDHYSFNLEKGQLYIHRDNCITVYDIESLEEVKHFLSIGKFIKFLDNKYVIEYVQDNYCEIWLSELYSGKTTRIHMEYPVFSICDIETRSQDVNDLIQEISTLDKGHISSASITVINTIVKEIYAINDDIYVLSSDRTISVPSRKVSWTNEMLTCNNHLLDLSFSHPRCKVNNGLLYMSEGGKTYILRHGIVVYKTTDEIYVTDKVILFCNKEEDKIMVYYLLPSKESTGCLKKIINKEGTNYLKWDLSAFKDYNVICDYSRNICIYLSGLDTEEWAHNQKVVGEKDLGYFKNNANGFVKNNVIDKGKFIWRNNVPDEMINYSQSLKYGLSKVDGKISLITFDLLDNDSYKIQTILQGLYDTTEYRNVVFSDNGRFVLYREKGKNILMDTLNNKKVPFDLQNYVTSVNGYRSMLGFDPNGEPRIIDPMTLSYVDGWDNKKYTFHSPNGELYANKDFSKDNRYYNLLDKTYISKEKVDKYKEQYDFSLFSDDQEKSQKKKLRKKFIEENVDFFEEKNINYLLSMYKFSESFIELRNFLYVYSSHDDSFVEEIQLGSKLWFLNYISFSYDSRYIGIVGRFQYDANDVQGLLLIYDLKGHKEVFRKTDSYAVWNIAFTKHYDWAAYSSSPTTYIGNAAEKEVNETISGKSFLTFSVDGKYMALSEQGYVAFASGYNCWGHIPSTKVYIYDVTNKKPVHPEINDLSDNGIDSLGEANRTVAAVSFSSNNDKIMMSGSDGVIIIRNLYIKENASK